MATKTKETKAAEDAATKAAEDTATKAAEDEGVPVVTLPKGWITASSEHRQVDPFEGTVFPAGETTPTKKTNWVVAQLSAGVLVEQ